MQINWRQGGVPLDAIEGSGDSHHPETWTTAPGGSPEAPFTFFPLSSNLGENYFRNLIGARVGYYGLG